MLDIILDILARNRKRKEATEVLPTLQPLILPEDVPQKDKAFPKTPPNKRVIIIDI